MPATMEMEAGLPNVALIGEANEMRRGVTVRLLLVRCRWFGHGGKWLAMAAGGWDALDHTVQVPDRSPLLLIKQTTGTRWQTDG